MSKQELIDLMMWHTREWHAEVKAGNKEQGRFHFEMMKQLEKAVAEAK